MNRQKGVTLIELMIVIAIVAIIGAIAIPAYNGYVQEPTTTELNTLLGWSPDGDKGNYNYAVSLAATTYHLLVTDASDSSIWVLCKSRFTDCCDSSQFAAGTTPNVATTTCP
jgi:prepilin-type N-terminal cleavage/methylation domain-containing protein